MALIFRQGLLQHVTYNGGGSSRPPAPDPYAVTAASNRSNQGTAEYNNAQTHGSTSTPLGSQSSTSHIDPRTGAVVYDTTVSLAPDQQKLLDLQNKQNLGMGGVGTGLLSQVKDAYGKPLPASSYSFNDLSTARSDAEKAYYGREASYLDPQYKQKGDALDVQLANEGLTPGSQPWLIRKQELGRESSFDYSNARRDAIAGGLSEMQGLTGVAHQQLADELTRRNEPLNEYNAVRSASPVTIPNFPTPQTLPAANSQLDNNVYSSYAGQVAGANQDAQNRNAVTSGLFGLGASVLGAPGDSVIGGVVNKGIGLFGGAGAAGGAEAAGAAGAGAAGAAGVGGGAGLLGGASTFTPSLGIPFSGAAAVDSGAAITPALLPGGEAAGGAGTGAALGTAGAVAGGAAAAYGLYKIGNHYNWMGNNNPSRIGESHVPPGAQAWTGTNGKDNIIGIPSPSGAVLAMQVNHGSAPGDPVLYPKGADPKAGVGGWELKGFRKGEDTVITNQKTGQTMKITDPAFQSTFGLTADQFKQMFQLATSSYTQ